MKTIFNLCKNFKPLFFFSIFAAVMAAVAVGFFIPLVLVPYLQTGLVEHFPTLIVCGFSLIAAILSLFAGLMLETMTLKNRQDFEFQLLRIQNEKAAKEQKDALELTRK